MQRRRFLAGAALSTASTLLIPRRALAAVNALDAKAFHAARRFVTTACGRTAYVERGRGPAALFLHGLPLNGFQWRGALERLADVRRCIAPDSMGLGYTEVAPGQDVGPESQARMFVAFLDALRIDRVDLVASDSGGAIAQLLVAQYPGRIRTLLLTNCDAHEDSPPPALKPVIEMSKTGRFADEVLAPQLKDVAASRLASGLGGCCYTKPEGLTPEALSFYLTPILRSVESRRLFHAYCVALERNPLLAIEPALKVSAVPLRVVWGTGDTIFDPKSAAWLDHTFPKSRGVRLVEGGNLFFPEEMPDVIAQEAQALWSSVRGVV